MHQLSGTPHYMGPIISTDLYISLEMQRWILHNETPGRFGYFEGEAAS